MTHQIHMRIEPFEVQGRQVGCEGCHGDGEAHMEEGDASLIRTFADGSTEDAAACLSCHSSKGLPEWKMSTHAMEGLNCLDCHSIHTQGNPLDSCKGCHEDVMAELQLPSHHPVREGYMSCSSCHDPHAATEAQLKTTGRVNDLCFTCHQAKEGPFIFEHEPVVEDCRLCHTPHGAVANNLLTANEPMLCFQCHEPHFHAGLVSPEEETIDVGGFERENPFGVHGMNIAFTTRCTQCHSQIHGTDLPSQALAGGGRGLVR
jgi:DmsE family decaheme c-type cytochrome